MKRVYIKSKIHFLISKTLIIISAAVLLVCSNQNLFSQCSAFPTGGGGSSVDPPTLVWENYMMPGCTEILLARSNPPYCPIQGPNPPLIQIFASFPITQTCMLFTNSYWNSWGLNVTYCWGTRVYGGGMNWQPGFNLTRLEASLPVVSLISPPNGATYFSTTPLMDWSNIVDANSYRLSIYTEACCINMIFDSTTNSDELTIPHCRLSGNTTYYWRVKPYKTAGEGPYSDPFYFTTDLASGPTLISPPFGSTLYTTTPLLDWDSIPCASYYNVTLMSMGYPGGIIFDSTGILLTNIRIPPGILSPGLQIGWDVRAYYPSGYGRWSSGFFYIASLPLDPYLISPPSGSTGQSLTPLLDWEGFFADSFQVHVSKFSDFGINIIDTSGLVSSTMQIPPGRLEYDSLYYWRVRGQNIMGNGPWSNSWWFTTLPDPSVPVLISPPNGANGLTLTPALDWSDVPNASKYRIQLSEQPNFSSKLIDDSTVTLSQFTVPPGILSIGTNYYWRAAASNNNIWSLFSVPWVFTTRGMPLQVFLIFPQNNSIGQQRDLTFVWHKANETLQKSGALFESNKLNENERDSINLFSKENIYIDAINNYWFEFTSDTVTLAGLIRDTLVTDTVKSLSGLNFSAAYYWRVKAKGDLGWGPFSNWWSFTTKTGIPLQVVLDTPPDNAAEQHINLAFKWHKPFETLLYPFGQKTAYSKHYGIDAINLYWFEITTDTVNLSGLVIDSLLTDTVKVMSGLNFSTSYYWRVKASGDSAWGPFSEWWKFTTLDGLPEKVFLISPENNSADQPTSLTFSWFTPEEIFLKPYNTVFSLENNTDAVNTYWFELTADTVTMAGILRDTLLTDTSRNVNGLNYYTTYYWRVKAKNEVGWGSFSDWWQFTTTDGLPKQVYLFYPENNSFEQSANITFQWFTPYEILLKPDMRNGIKGNTGKYYTDAVSSYWFELTTDPETFADLIRDTTVTDTAKTLSGLNYSTTFYWRVKAKNQNGWGPFSDWWLFTTTDGLPKQVILFSPENESYNISTNLTLTWYTPSDILLKRQLKNNIKGNTGKNNTDAISLYWFEITTDPETFSDLFIDSTITDTSKTMNGLNQQTTYYWRVKAKNENGWGPFSDWWLFTTFYVAIPELLNPENASVNITIIPSFDWYDAEGAENYSMQISTDTAFINPVLDSNGLPGSEFYAYCGLLNYDTLYYWRARSNNVIENSAWSEPWSFTVYSKPEWYLQCTGWQGMLVDIYFINEFTGWACGYGGIIKTTTGGEGWFPVNNGIISDCYSVFFANENTGWAADNTNLIYKTSDGGNSWYSGTVSGYGYKSIEFINSNTGYFTNNSGLYNVISGKSYKGRLGFSFDQGIFKTTDGGNDWFFLDVPVTTNYYSVTFPGSGPIGYACGGSSSGYLLKTTNAGVNWTELDVSESPVLIDLSFINQLTGWAAGLNSTVLYTSNGGTNWELRNNSIFDDLISVYFINENTGWICGYNFYKTTDAGNNWNFIPNYFSGLKEITFKNGIGWISGEAGVVLKNDSETENPVPVLISPSNGAAGVSLTPLLDWSDVTGANKYRVQVSTDENFSNTIVDDSNITVSQYQVLSGALSANTLYYWKVKAKGNFGWGMYSGWWNFTTTPAAPEAPILVSPLNNSAGIILPITLIWNSSPSAAIYRLQLSTDSLFNTFIINDSTQADTSEIITVLNPLTNYYWRVAAKNAGGGWSAFSARWTFKTLGYPEPVPLVSPANNSVNQPVNIDFIWNKTAEEQLIPFLKDEKKFGRNNLKKTISGKFSSDESETIGNYWFELTTDTITFAGIIRDTTLSDTSKTVNGLLNSAKYFWRVKAKNEYGWGGFSFWWNFTTVPPPPAIPVLVSPLNYTTGLNIPVTLIWNSSPQAVNYRLQLSTDSLFSSFIINDSTQADTTETVFSLNPLTYYYWRVAAKNAGGWSGFSARWTFKTLGSPTQVILVSPPNNAIDQPVNQTFIWRKALDQQLLTSINIVKKIVIKTDKITKSGVNAIGNYWFELTTDTVTFAGIIRDSLLTDTIKTVNGLANTTSYYWRVKAKNEIGWGSFSAWFKFTTFTVLNVNINYNTDWNMISIPVNANPNGVRSIFPNCTPPAFYYNNGYQSDTILVPGKGFWLFFSSGGVQNLSGLPVNPQIIPVTQDWNMIGVFENNIAVSSITSNPPGIINSLFFKYSNGYTIADTLKPGVAYWVNVTQNGNLILPSGADVPSNIFTDKSNQININVNWVKIIISDNSGKKSVLYLGKKEEMNNQYLLPPAPPMGIFDVRFGSGSYAEMLGQSKHEISIQSDKYPIKIRAENLSNLKLQLKDNITGKLIDRVLTDNSEISINEHINSFVLIEEELPKVFSLSQNYPNPFNPLTHIKYGIPRKVNVKMVLYDLLGREVKTLVNGIQETGYYTIDLYADDIASGVYFYRIEAGNFTDVKKLLIIK
jgi:photosystem II stability/assembly factor-like uncharacterized protein